ncbi:MAG: hypothetical protein KDA90_00765 [Planctomycetaceae bacterium]|nr:hypothetical protein [Planctomycetaceae bacterium]
MVNWFSSAANVFRREESNGPQPFQLACQCGMTHSGLRRQRHQHLVCKSCGASVFVLPGDVYPPPRETKRKRPEEGPISVPESTDSPMVSEGVPSGPKPKRQEPVMSMPTIAEKPPDMDAVDVGVISVGPKALKKKKEVPQEPPPEPPPAGPSLGETLRDIFTPFRLIVAGVLLLLVLTGMWQLRKWSYRDALTTVEAEIELGHAALEDQNWVEARDHFGQAVAAIDILGRTDAQAQEVRQLHRETRVLTRLTGGSIFEVIEAGDQFLKTGKVEDVGEFLRGRFGVDWFVFDGPVRRREKHPDRDKKVQHPFELLLPWTPESKRQVIIQVDFDCLDPLVSSQEPRRLLLAGKFGSCELVDDTWVFRLEPESGFAWANAATYRALGIPADPQESGNALQALLQEQAKAMGVTE